MTVTADDFNTVIADIGSYVSIRTGSISFSFGESSTTYTTGSTLAIAQHISESDDLVKQGLMNIGDIRVFVRGDNTDLDSSGGKDKVEMNWEGNWYERDGFPIVRKVGDNINHQELLFRRK